MDGLALMLIFGFAGIAVLLIAAVIEKVHQTRRFVQRDWVAEQHRRVSHRGFKSRAGMRS